MRSSTATLPRDDRARLGELPATTLHRLLGWRPESRSRFRHDRDNRLPYEVVVVDETSMVSLTMMARLLEALRPTPGWCWSATPTSSRRSRPARCWVTWSTRTVARVAVATLATNRRFPATSGIALLAAAVQDGRGIRGVGGAAVRRDS